MAAYLTTQVETQHIQIFDEQKQPHQVELPISALRLLVDSLAEPADGNKLLEEGELAFHRTGKRRRVRFADLLQFKETRERASEQAMAELAQQSQELGMGYE